MLGLSSFQSIVKIAVEHRLHVLDETLPRVDKLAVQTPAALGR